MARSDEIIHAETRALFAYWEHLRDGRIAPFRAEVDPRDMSCEARHLFIIEILDDGSQRFRLAGTQVIDTFGMELRGHSARIIMEGRARESFSALIAETLAEPGIGYTRLRPAGHETGDEVWEMLLLPLRSENGNLDRLIGVLHQISGVRRRERLLPLRFSLDRMWIEPIPVTAADEAEPQPMVGFAEEQKGFTGLPAPGRARLTAIEGGRHHAGQPQQRRHARPALRLIKDD